MAVQECSINSNQFQQEGDVYPEDSEFLLERSSESLTSSKAEKIQHRSSGFINRCYIWIRNIFRKTSKTATVTSFEVEEVSGDITEEQSESEPEGNIFEEIELPQIKNSSAHCDANQKT